MTKELGYSFGTWMRHRRKTLDLTQPELAERLHCSVNTIKKLETDARRPSKQLAELLAVQFHIPEEQRSLFIEYARGDWQAVPGETKEDSPWQSSTKTPRKNLPASTTSLVGREKEIANVRDYLERANLRLVTLIGPPGIGKTRLSIEAAQVALPAFPDGVFFVALAPLNDSSLVAPAIVQSLGFVTTSNLPATQQLIHGIGDKRMLLVLDNCEHLIEDVAPLVSNLLSACSHVEILATSRESLRVSGEWLFPVPTLDVPEESSSIDMETAAKFPALTLFAERARAVRPDFTLTADNVGTVSAICGQLDGLPLAIELIAARMRLMSPQALLERFKDRFILSADGMRPASARQKTLNNAIAWSYNLLPAEEQKLFAYLSVFSGGFTLESAEAILSGTATEKSVPDLVASLLDKSLLQLIPDREAYGEPHYTMLVTIQEFARMCLNEMGEEMELRNRHLAYFIDLAEKGDEEMHGPNQTEWLNRFNTMSDNLRAALEWALKSGGDMKAERLLFALRDLWFMGVHLSEGIERAKSVLVRKYPAQTASARLKALNTYLYLLWFAPVSTKADPLNPGTELASIGEEALHLGAQLNDRRGIAFTLLFLGYAVAEQQSYALAHSYLDQSLEIWRSLEDETYTGLTLGALGELAMYEHKFAHAQKLFEQAVPPLREAGKHSYLGIPLRRLGQLAILQGEPSRAMALIQESLQLNWTIRDYDGICSCVAAMGALCAAAGQSVGAAKLFGVLDAVFEFTRYGMMPLDQQEYERGVSELRGQLDDATFTAAWVEGRTMTLEQAVAYALELPTSL